MPGVVLAAAVTLGVCVAPPANAAGATLQFLNSSTRSVTTTTGAKLHLSISASKSTASGSKSSVVVTLATGTAYTLGETHQWLFSLPGSAFAYSAGSGKATLSTGTRISPYGTLQLTFRRSSQHTSSCKAGGTLTTVRGTLAGTVHFVTNTGTHGWGSLGSATKTMTFSTPNTVTLNAGCGTGSQGGTLPCVTGTNWNGPSTGSAFTFGLAAGGTSTMTGQRNAVLRKPAGASRLDMLVAAAPAPTLASGTLTIKTSPHTAMSGSATITASANGADDHACRSGSTTKTQHTTYYSAGSWWATKLVFHFRVTGAITAPAGGTASFATQSFS